MKKTFRIVFISFFLTCLIPALSVGATDLTDQFGDLTDLTPLLPEGIEQDDLILDPSPESLLFENIFTEILSAVKKIFSTGLYDSFYFFLSLLALLLLCAVLKTVKNHLSPQAAQITDTLSLLVLSAFLYTFIRDAFTEATHYLNHANTFMTAMIPVTTTLYAVGGNAATATVQNATLLFALSFLQTLTSTVFLPLLRFCFAFSLVGLVSPIKLGSITQLLKTITTTLCVFFLTLLSAILFFQNILSSAADSVGTRSVKFLIGLIPVVGNLVGDASKTVATSVTYLRSVMGLFGVVVILSLLLLPLCRLAARKLFLSLGQTAASVLGLDAEAAFLKEAASLLTLVFAVLLSSCLYFLLALTLFMKTTVVSA